MKKKRWENNDFIDSNRFDLLEYMPRKKLTLVMRNSIQVHDLLEVTKKVLKSVETSHKLQEKIRKDVQEEEEYAQNNEDTNKSEEVKIIKTETLEETMQFVGSNLELDEALNYAKDLEAHETVGTVGSSITSRFEYEEATDIGHRGESKLPVLFEICDYDNTFQKTFSLTAVFESLQLRRSAANFKHVLLHFNFNNEITRLEFKLLDLKHNSNVTDKVTYSYEDFKNEECKKIHFRR